jgi:hypothetical protein
MKTLIRILIVATMFTSGSCKKEKTLITDSPVTSSVPDNYSSMEEFYGENCVPLHIYTVDAVTGGDFTTLQGTHVSIPANAFTTLAGGTVTGNVVIQFKDIYKKSDMLLSNKPAQLFWGGPLKSGGEFFIKALQNNNPIILAANKKIDIEQPAAAAGAEPDTAMEAMGAALDSLGGAIGGNNVNPVPWQPSPDMGLLFNTSGYIFSLYQFNNPADSGTWCNSDNPYYFPAFPDIALTLHPNDDPMIFFTDVFLVFGNINSMVHVYHNFSNLTDFVYDYAPSGLQCTVVAIGLKDGKLYSSFTPITIGSNAQTVNFTLSETTTHGFKARLNTLN